MLKPIALLAVMALTAAACTQGRTEESSTTTAGSSGTTTLSASFPEYTPPPPAPIALVVRRPSSLTEPLLGAAVDLGVHVLAEHPIAKVQMWDGSELVAEESLAGANTEESALLSWVPASAGLHVALARAIDIEGNTAQAFPVWFRVVDPGSAGGEAARETQPSLSGVAATSRLFAQTGLAPLPAPPRVSTDADACEVSVEVAPASGAGGIAVWGTRLGAVGFAPLAVLGPSGGSLTVPAADVPQVVFVEPYDRNQARPSKPAWIPPVDSCKDLERTGDLDIARGVIQADASIDRVYLYVSADLSEWSRVPAADHTFVYRSRTGFDFSSLLTIPESGEKLHLEAWGWSAGQLIWLGRAELASAYPTQPQTALAVPTLATAIPKTGLWWIESAANPQMDIVEKLSLGTSLCTYEPVPSGGIAVYKNCSRGIEGQGAFRLANLPPGADGSIWQVSVLPPPDGPAFGFLGLLESGAAKEGDFSIDLSAVLKPPTEPNTASASDQDKYQGYVQLSLGAGGGSGGASSTVKESTNPTLPTALKPRTLYVRVMPTMAGQPIEGVSNVVKFDLVHEPPLEATPLKTKYLASVQVTKPGLPNDKWLRCVRILDNPFPFDINVHPSKTPQWVEENNFDLYGPGNFQPELWFGAFPTAPDGSTMCGFKPDPPSKGVFDYIADAIEFVSHVWDMAVTLYEMAKDAVVQGIIAITFCDQLASEDACETIASTGLSLVMTAVGLPPTLPSFEEATEALKGDLVDFLVEQALEQGPCGTVQTLCEEIAKDMLDGLVDKIQEQVAQATTKTILNQGYIFALHPGIKAIPEPAGTLHGPSVRITLTRPDIFLFPESSSCPYSAHVTGEVFYGWEDWKNDVWREELVTGEPFAPVSGVMDMSGVGPGESKTVFFALSEWVPWFPPGQDNSMFQMDKFKPQGDIFFRPGATMTVQIVSTCFDTVEVSFPQDGWPDDPEDIPAS